MEFKYDNNLENLAKNFQFSIFLLILSYVEGVDMDQQKSTLFFLWIRSLVLSLEASLKRNIGKLGYIYETFWIGWGCPKSVALSAKRLARKTVVVPNKNPNHHIVDQQIHRESRNEIVKTLAANMDMSAFRFSFPDNGCNRWKCQWASHRQKHF